MTSAFRARSRAEELDALLGGRIPAEHAHAETRELAGVVATLRTQPEVAPRGDFAVALRERLMTEAAEVLVPTPFQHPSTDARTAALLTLPPRHRGKRERRLVAIASVVVVLGGSASMAAAAQHALPGEALYPLKRGIEHAQTGLSTSPEGKGRDLLSQADDRLTEARGLLARSDLGTGAEVPGTISDFTAQAREGADLMMQSFRSNQDPATMVAVRRFAANGVATLQDLARTAPPQAQDELAAAATALSEIDAQARGLCRTCAQDLPDLDVPPMFLTSADVSRAISRAHDSTKLSNDHPVVVDDKLTRLLGGLLATPSPAPSKAPSDGGSPSGPTDTNPLPPLLPSLPTTGSSTSNGTVDPGKAVTDLSKTVDDVTGTLTAPLKTLLPDTSDPTLP